MSGVWAKVQEKNPNIFQEFKNKVNFIFEVFFCHDLNDLQNLFHADSSTLHPIEKTGSGSWDKKSRSAPCVLIRVADPDPTYKEKNPDPGPKYKKPDMDPA